MARTSASEGGETGPTIVLDSSAESTVMQPSGVSLLTVSYTRAENDLVLTAPDGRVVLVRGYFDNPHPPDLGDATGLELAGEIVVRLAEGDLELSPEELADITGFVTEAGAAQASPLGQFDVDFLAVTLFGGSDSFEPLNTPQHALSRFAYDSGYGIETPRNPVELRLPESEAPQLADAAPDAPSRIRTVFFEGRAFEALAPNAANPTSDFYQETRGVYLERLDTAPLRRFLPADGDTILMMTAGSIAAPGFEGGLDGSTWADIAQFAGVPEDSISGGPESEGPVSDPVDGGAIRTLVDAPPGSTVLADVLFDARAFDTFNDFAFAAADGDLFVFAEAQDVQDGATGWMTIAFRNDTDGIGQIAFGVVNDNSTLNDPVLVVDNIRVGLPLSWSDRGGTVTVGGDTLQFVDTPSPGTADPNTQFAILARPPTATNDTARMDENGSVDSQNDAEIGGLLDNDQAPSPSLIEINEAPQPGTPHFVDAPMPMWISEMNGSAAGVGSAVEVISQGGRTGILTVEADGSWRFDTANGFSDLEDGESDTVEFTYTAVVPSGGFSTGTVTMTIDGVGGRDILSDFEKGVLPGSEVGNVEIVTSYTDGAFDAQPESGSHLLKLETADGFFPVHVYSLLLGTADDDLSGLPIGFRLDLLDHVPEDSSQADVGSAFRLTTELQPESLVSFYWSFDNAEAVGGNDPAPLGYNDRAYFTILDMQDPDAPVLLDIFRIVDGRTQFDLTDGTPAGHLEQYWSSWAVPALDDPRYGLDSRYAPGEAFRFGLGWGLLNDNASAGDSVFLIDLVEVQALDPGELYVPAGYTSVPQLTDGDFHTYAPSAT